MKTLIAAGLLLALAIPAAAETCTGRVKIDVATSDQGLYPKGYKQFSVGGCVLEDPALQKRVLRACPIGSRCRIEGAYAGDDAIESIDSVTRVPAHAAVEELKELYRQCMLGPWPEAGAWKICDPAKDLTKDMEDHGYCFRAQPDKGVISTVRCKH